MRLRLNPAPLAFFNASFSPQAAVQPRHSLKTSALQADHFQRSGAKFVDTETLEKELTRRIEELNLKIHSIQIKVEGQTCRVVVKIGNKERVIKKKIVQRDPDKTMNTILKTLKSFGNHKQNTTGPRPY